MEVTPSASTNIQWIEVEFLRDEEDRASKRLTDKTSVVYAKSLESGIVELHIEVGITSPCPTLHSSSAPIPSIDAQIEVQATNDQPALTKSTIIAFGWLAKEVDLQDNRVESFFPKVVEAAIAKALWPYIAIEVKQQELMEVYKLRMDRLKLMIDDHGKELANLKDTAAILKKVGGGSGDTLALKAYFDLLEKEVAALLSMNLSTLFDGLDDPLKVDIVMVLDDKLKMNVLGDGSKETHKR